MVWPLFLCGCAATRPTGEAAPPARRATTPTTPIAPDEETPPSEVAEPVGKRLEYAPGVVIDFAQRQVEVAAEVALREGLLELLACSPRTKEHESILVALPRPWHIYQALGLVGLTPGHPAAWDPKHKRGVPPTGDELTISITYQRDGERVEVDAWDWLQALRTGEPAPPRPWIFTGSLTSPRDGSFAADYDGNVISLVAFGTELLGLAEVFSPDNDQLWLCPRTERIPPLGTSCTLIFRPLDQTPGAR